MSSLLICLLCIDTALVKKRGPMFKVRAAAQDCIEKLQDSVAFQKQNIKKSRVAQDFCPVLKIASLFLKDSST